METDTYQLLEVINGKPIKMWTEGVPVENEAKEQLMNTARMPFIFKHLAVMPDVHLGKGSTIGSVIPTVGAIIPAAVGVDIGCGMIAARTSLTASDLPDNLAGLRSAIEKAVPHGRTSTRSRRDKGAWDEIPQQADNVWGALYPRFNETIGPAMPGMTQLVADLDAAGVPLYAITNFSGEFWPPFRAREAAFFAPFRDVVVSGDEKLMKPDAAIYRLALGRFGLQAGDAVFVDDNAGNVAGANAVGIRGLLFTDAASLRIELQALDLL